MGPRALLFIILLVVALMIYAIFDCARRTPSEIRTLPKTAWMFVIILLPAIGTVLWFMMGRTRAAAAGGGDAGRPAARKGPVAPDDDPEFLRQIEIARRQRERRSGDSGGTRGTGPAHPGAGKPSDGGSPPQPPKRNTGGADGDEPENLKPENFKPENLDPHDASSGNADDDDKK